jgi:hypothetical protein
VDQTGHTPINFRGIEARRSIAIALVRCGGAPARGRARTKTVLTLTDHTPPTKPKIIYLPKMLGIKKRRRREAVALSAAAAAAAATGGDGAAATAPPPPPLDRGPARHLGYACFGCNQLPIVGVRHLSLKPVGANLTAPSFCARCILGPLGKDYAEVRRARTTHHARTHHHPRSPIPSAGACVGRSAIGLFARRTTGRTSRRSRRRRRAANDSAPRRLATSSWTCSPRRKMCWTRC